MERILSLLEESETLLCEISETKTKTQNFRNNDEETEKRIETQVNELNGFVDSLFVQAQKREREINQLNKTIIDSSKKAKIELQNTIQQKNMTIEKIKQELSRKPPMPNDNSLENEEKKKRLDEERKLFLEFVQKEKRTLSNERSRLDREKTQLLKSRTENNGDRNVSTKEFERTFLLMLWQFSSNTEETNAALSLDESLVFTSGMFERLDISVKDNDYDRIESILGIILNISATKIGRLRFVRFQKEITFLLNFLSKYISDSHFSIASKIISIIQNITLEKDGLSFLL